MDIETAQYVFGRLSRLLQYPDRQWRERLAEAREETEFVTDEEARRILSAFLEQSESSEELEWLDRYVRTFDFGKKSNLYLTYSEHGEERERGAALIELKRRYAEAGFEIEGGELPDYLPLVLEFASAAPWEAAIGVLSGAAKPLRSIHAELKETASPYADLLGLLLRLVPGADRASIREETLLGKGAN